MKLGNLAPLMQNLQYWKKVSELRPDLIGKQFCFVHPLWDPFELRSTWAAGYKSERFVVQTAGDGREKGVRPANERAKQISETPDSDAPANSNGAD